MVVIVVKKANLSIFCKVPILIKVVATKIAVLHAEINPSILFRFNKSHPI